jgi:hypothetical protein
MSALSAIETPVAVAPETHGADTTELGHRGRPLRAVGGPVRSIAVRAREGAIADGQPRSSSIPAAGSRSAAATRADSRVAQAASVVAAPVLAGRVVDAASVGAVPGAGSNPPRTRPRESRGAGASSRRTRLRASPAAGASSPPARLRLTRRGRIVVAALVLAGVTTAALLITLLASGGAQATNHGPARAGYQGMHQVVVQPGQTLWSIAAAAEPTADPRTVVQEIMSANTLAGPAISAGQLLWVP